MFLLIAAPCDCSLLVRPTLPRILTLTKKEPKTPLMTMARAICPPYHGGVPSAGSFLDTGIRPLCYTS